MASHAETVLFPAPPHHMFQLLSSVLSGQGYLPVSIDPGALHIEARTPHSFWRWPHGENLSISVGPEPYGSGSAVAVRSRSRMALVDWGRNRRNIDQVIAELRTLTGLGHRPYSGGLPSR